MWCSCSETQIGNGCFQGLIGVRRSSAIDPIQRQRRTFADRRLSCLLGELGYDFIFSFFQLCCRKFERGKIFQWPGEHISPPRKYISESRLPHFRPHMPGITEPSTCPQMPLIVLLPTTSVGDTIMSQVDVPITRTRVNSSTSAPTAPACASKVPTLTTVLLDKPDLAAHSSLSVPAD